MAANPFRRWRIASRNYDLVKFGLIVKRNLLFIYWFLFKMLPNSDKPLRDVQDWLESTGDYYVRSEASREVLAWFRAMRVDFCDIAVRALSGAMKTSRDQSLFDVLPVVPELLGLEWVFAMPKWDDALAGILINDLNDEILPICEPAALLDLGKKRWALLISQALRYSSSSMKGAASR